MYGSLVEVSVDTTELDQRLDGLVTEDRVQELIAAKVEQYISDESLMSHSAVVDTIEEHIKDNLDISGEVDEALSGRDYQDSDDVQQAIEDAIEKLDIPEEGMTESEVKDLIDEAIAEADNADVDALETKQRDLERRLDLYANKVDALIPGTQGMGTDVAALQAEAVVLQRRMDAFQATLHDQVTRIEALEARIGDSNVGEALTLTDLLRRAAAILGIGGRA